eukprot:TRINITY_DN120123_c1_g1_i1.p1 TRINITY_DN120123_c1_g1~~TRINITY_DN120123_c1_g1_i1.p1  ORF type:complete len:637 (+),score=56.16 TRINITY_DN120123_c1_g1_i1:418-2328(+)
MKFEKNLRQLAQRWTFIKMAPFTLKSWYCVQSTSNQSTMLEQLPAAQRGPVGDFLVAYMKQTKKVVTTLPVFVVNAIRAYEAGKFGLKEMIEYCQTLYNANNRATNREFELNEDEIANLETVAKKTPAQLAIKSNVGGRCQTEGNEPNKKARPTRHSVRAVISSQKKKEISKKPSPKPTVVKNPAKSPPKRSKPPAEAPKVATSKETSLAAKKKVPKESPVGKYAKLAQKKMVAKSAPKSSYERPTKAYMLRHKLNQFLTKKQSVTTDAKVPAINVRQVLNEEDKNETVKDPFINKQAEPIVTPLSPCANSDEFTETLPEVKCTFTLYNQIAPAEDAEIRVFTDQEIPEIPPIPTSLPLQSRRDRSQPQQQKQKLQNDFLIRSDSISEDAEFQCDDDFPVKPALATVSVSQSTSWLGKAEDLQDKQSQRKKYPRASSCDTHPALESEHDGVISPPLSRNDRFVPNLDFSDNFNSLKEGYSINNNGDVEFNIVEGKGRNAKEFEAGKLQVMTLGDLQDLNNMVQQKTDSASHKHNIYDIKSQKKLQYVLRNGYSYKYHEKKHYNAYQKKIVRPEPAVKPKGQPSEMALLAALKSIYYVTFNTKMHSGIAVTTYGMQRIGREKTRVLYIFRKYQTNLQ